MSGDDLSSAIRRGVGFLADRQLSYGEIRTVRAEDRALEQNPVFDSSPYATTYVLYSLGFVRDPAVAAIERRAREFLADEMEPPGVWRYYSSRNPKILPPDLDDTACAALVLRPHLDQIRQGLHFRIFLANRDREGRFRTFLADGGNSVDAVVNANVVCYLGEREETRAACDFLRRFVLGRREGETSIYGVDELSLYYVLSRAYFQGAKGLADCAAPILDALFSRQGRDGSFGDEISTAFALATLANFEIRESEKSERVDRAASWLAAQQRADGSWPRAAFYIDFGGGYYGSEELSTAFALEALARTAPLA